MHELLERIPLCIGTVYLCRMFSSTNIYKPVIQLISLFLTNVCFFCLRTSPSVSFLRASRRRHNLWRHGSPCHWVNCCRSGLVDGWSFRWALLTCLTGIQGWEMWESRERWNLLIIRFTSILKIDDLSLSLSLQGLVQLLSSAIWSFKGPGPVDSMAGFAWLNFIFPLYLQHEVLRTSLGYTKDMTWTSQQICVMAGNFASRLPWTPRLTFALICSKQIEIMSIQSCWIHESLAMHDF